MKKEKIFILIILCFIFSCTKTEDKTKDLKPLDEIEEFKLHLSSKDKIEDYEYFWGFIYNGWPFLEVCQRKNIDLKKIKKQNYENLEKINFKADYNSLYEDICYEISGHYSLGHLYPLQYNEYIALKERYEYPIINESGIENETIIKFYDSKPKDPYDYRGKFKIRKDNNTCNEKNSLPQSKIIKDNKIAYLKLETFYLTSQEKKEYYNTIYNFLVKTKNYKHLIIDISNNNGGYSECWIEPRGYSHSIHCQLPLLRNTGGSPDSCYCSPNLPESRPPCVRGCE